MNTVKVKICGITRKEDLKIICELGADAVGFIVGVPSSPRNLSPKEAEKLIKLVPVFVKSVVVITPKSIEEILKINRRLKPDVIQIHGRETLDALTLRKKLSGTHLIKAVAVKSKDSIKNAIKESEFFDAILLDSYSPKKYGGTGITHSWGISRCIRDTLYPKPVILAGGLNPENVKTAIQIVKPYAVDVSTGVEAKPGIKDPEKVEAFIKNVKKVNLSNS